MSSAQVCTKRCLSCVCFGNYQTHGADVDEPGNREYWASLLVLPFTCLRKPPARKTERKKKSLTKIVEEQIQSFISRSYSAPKSVSKRGNKKHTDDKLNLHLIRKKLNESDVKMKVTSSL